MVNASKELPVKKTYEISIYFIITDLVSYQLIVHIYFYNIFLVLLILSKYSSVSNTKKIKIMITLTFYLNQILKCYHRLRFLFCIKNIKTKKKILYVLMNPRISFLMRINIEVESNPRLIYWVFFSNICAQRIEKKSKSYSKIALVIWSYRIQFTGFCFKMWYAFRHSDNHMDSCSKVHCKNHTNRNKWKCHCEFAN